MYKEGLGVNGTREEHNSNTTQLPIHTWGFVTRSGLNPFRLPFPKGLYIREVSTRTCLAQDSEIILRQSMS